MSLNCCFVDKFKSFAIKELWSTSFIFGWIQDKMMEYTNSSAWCSWRCRKKWDLSYQQVIHSVKVAAKANLQAALRAEWYTKDHWEFVSICKHYK